MIVRVRPAYHDHVRSPRSQLRHLIWLLGAFSLYNAGTIVGTPEAGLWPRQFFQSLLKNFRRLENFSICTLAWNYKTISNVTAIKNAANRTGYPLTAYAGWSIFLAWCPKWDPENMFYIPGLHNSLYCPNAVSDISTKWWYHRRISSAMAAGTLILTDSVIVSTARNVMGREDFCAGSNSLAK